MRAGTRPCLGAQVLHITQSALRPLRQHQLRSFALPNSPDVAHRSAQSSSVIITWRLRTHNGDHRNTNIHKNGAKEAAGHVSSSSEVCRGGVFLPMNTRGRRDFFFFFFLQLCGCCLFLQEEAETRSGKAKCLSEGFSLRFCAYVRSSKAWR